MEMSFLDRLTQRELEELKKEINKRITPKQPKITRSEKVELVREKLQHTDSTYNYHELMYAFEVLCKDNNYPITVNLRDDVVFVTKLFGAKPKEGFGTKQIAIFKKYIEIYAKTYKTSDFPVPSLKGLGQSWIACKVIDLVDIDMKQVQVGEISDVEF